MTVVVRAASVASTLAQPASRKHTRSGDGSQWIRGTELFCRARLGGFRGRLAQMQQISSNTITTFYYKRAFPFIIFPASIAATVITGAKSGADLFPFLVFLVFVPIIGYASMKLIGLFDLVDEVLDAGDALIVRNGDREERTLFADIVDVNYTDMFGLPRLRLVLRTPSQFGNQITFCVPRTFLGFRPTPVIEELIRRIDTAREE